MTKDQIENSMIEFCQIAKVTRLNWSQKAAQSLLMALTRKILKAHGYAMPNEVLTELTECWEYKGLACNASQLRQHLFVTKDEPKALVNDPFKEAMEAMEAAEAAKAIEVKA